MKRSFRPMQVGLILALSALILTPVAVMGQDQSGDKASLTLQDVKDRLKQNKMFLEEAKKRGKAGDAPGLEIALENFGRSTEGLNRALSQDRFAGNDADREEAFARVEEATAKHTKVLTDLLTKVPEQARPAIEHALQVSQKGHDTALANLQRDRAQRQAVEQRQGVSWPDSVGRPDVIGRPSGSGQGMGRPGGAAGGPPSGRPGRPGGRP